MTSQRQFPCKRKAAPQEQTSPLLLPPWSLCLSLCLSLSLYLTHTHTFILSHVPLPPHGLQPTRLHCPWDSPGKNTGVGFHFLFQGIFSTQVSCISCTGRQILYHCATWGAYCLHTAFERSCSVMAQGRYRDEIAPYSMQVLVDLYKQEIRKYWGNGF